MNYTQDLASPELLVIFNTVNLAGITACIALCGIIANILNIIVFLKQGLNDTVNIGLFSLAVADLCSLVALEGICSMRNQLIVKTLPIIAGEVQHLVACWPHACFARTASWVTVYITFERCLCVVIPLKVKTIITPKLTVSVIAVIYTIMILTIIPEYLTCYLDWKFIPDRNRTFLGLHFFPGKSEVTVLNFYLAVGTQISAFIALIVFTAILVAKLKEKSKWRQSISTTGNSSTKETSAKENRTVMMIILVAVIYCVCFLPMLASFIASTLVPPFISFGAYNNLFFLVWSFAFMLDSINSSVNFLVYCRMSTKFRVTLMLMFGRRPGDSCGASTQETSSRVAVSRM